MNFSTLIPMFELACGLSIFLYGMQHGEKNLHSFGHLRIRKIIEIITRHRIFAYLTGAGITIITQSSSATTVMLVTFASANLMTLHQSLGMILGSNLGTTFTVQLFAFKFYQIAPLLIAIGYFLSLQPKNANLGKCGRLILAFGFVLFGMKMMSDSIEPLRTLPAVHKIIGSSLSNPFLGLFIGTLFTAIVQSSAATLAIVIAIAQSYIQSGNSSFSLAAYIPLILGANMGTCATAFISTLHANTEGVRVAWAHFIFKVTGVIVFFPLSGAMATLVESQTASSPLQIAFIHTIFNLALGVIFIPFLKKFSDLITMLIKPRKVDRPRYSTRYIHTKVLSLPVLALAQASMEITDMSEHIIEMVESSRDLINKFSTDLKTSIVDMDNEVDFLHEEIIKYLTKLSQSELGEEESSRAYELIMITTDLEHIGDIVSKSLATFASKINNSDYRFPEETTRELDVFFARSIQELKNMQAAFATNDKKLARTVYENREYLSEEFNRYCENHFTRIDAENRASIDITSVYIDLLEEIQRINSFTIRIAAHMLNIYRVE